MNKTITKKQRYITALLCIAALLAAMMSLAASKPSLAASNAGMQKLDVLDNSNSNVYVNQASQLVDENDVPLIAHDARPIFLNEYGQGVESSGKSLSVNSSKQLIDSKGYVVRRVDPSADVYLLLLKGWNAYMPVTIIYIKPTFIEKVLHGSAIAAIMHPQYYDLNGQKVEPSEYVKPWLSVFIGGSNIILSATGETVEDYIDPTVPSGDPAVDEEGGTIYDDLGQPIGINDNNQLVDPWGRPLFDSEARPVVVGSNGQYYNIQNVALVVVDSKLVDANGMPIRSVGSSFDGYVLLMPRGSLLIPAQSYIAGTFYDMNGKPLVEGVDYKEPSAVDQDESNFFVNAVERIYSAFSRAFNSEGGLLDWLVVIGCGIAGLSIIKFIFKK